MHDLSRIVARGITGKAPLRAPFRSWAERGMLFYPGSVHLLAGKAGTFKSMVALNAIVNMGETALAFSNDTDDLTTAARLLGMTTGRSVDEMRRWAVEGRHEAAAILRRYSFIRWAFDPNPELNVVWDYVHAYAERYGDWPRVILIDIASNVGLESSYDEWGALRELMRQANVLARVTNAAVIAVHHCGDGARTPDDHPCPSRADVMGKITALPVLITTMGKDSRGGLHAACVKARHAESDESGASSFRMHVDPSTGRVADYNPALARAAVGYAGGTWDDWSDR